MRRALLIFIAIVVLIPVTLLAWLAMTESGLHWAYQYLESELPGKLTMHKLEGRLIGPITLKGVEYQQGGALIKADQVLVDWRPLGLLAAKVDINRLHMRSLSVVLPPAENTGGPITLPEIKLPWRVALRDTIIDGVSVRQNEQSYKLNQVSLNATTLFTQVDIESLKINADNFSLNIQGEIHPTLKYQHDLKVHWQVKAPSQAVIEGNGELTGNMEMTRLKQQLTGPVQLTLNGTLKDLLGRLEWQAKADVSAFDVAQLGADWPAINGKLKLDGKGDLNTAILSGSVDGRYPELGPFDAAFTLQRLGDNTIQIDHLVLHAPGTDTRLQARGEWLPGTDGGNVSMALDWQNLRWPLKKPAWFDSAIGSAWIEGNIHRYRIGLATDRPWPQAPVSFWYASAEGNIDGLKFHSLRVAALDGETLARGQLAWTPQLAWDAQVSASAINPAQFLTDEAMRSQWSGQLNAKLSSSGRVEHGQLIADADITRLEGKLRGYPVSLRSRLGWRNHGIDISLLDFHSGSSQLSAQGRVGDTLTLDWSIATPDLAELYPRAKGQLQAKGSVNGPRKSPIIKAAINGQALHLPGYEMGVIDATVAVDLFHWQHVDINLAVQALNIYGYALQSLDINADTQNLTAKAVSETETVLVELKGEAYDKGWRGRIERADLQSTRLSDWQLKAPVAIDINNKLVAMDPLCWHNNQEGRLCATLKRENETWQTHLDSSKLPLALISPLLSPDLKLDGVANATAELQFREPDWLQGFVRIEFPSATVSFLPLEGEVDHWAYRNAKLDITMNEQGVEATAEMAMTNGDEIHGRFTLPGARPLALNRDLQSLQASAQMKIHDLGFVAAIIPELTNLRGEAELNIAAAGTLAQPNLSGQARLLNGAVRIPRLGLNIDQISLKSQSEGSDKLNFRLDAHSGEGNLSVEGQTILDSAAGWPTEISVKGKEFEVSHIPEAQVLVSPDLQIKLHNTTIGIKGDVHIPYAKLQPKDLTSAARVSKDAVIVSNHQKVEERWSISTRIRLTLGERVDFYGFGFEGRFGGSLMLVDEPGQLTTASGELSIPEGRYRAYGQRLDVEHGRLLYTGGPLTNPGLDLSAVRHVGEVTAGLKVRGSLNQPQIEVFSIPAMGQTDALSYLLLGRPMENASGEEGAMMAKAALALGLSGGNQLARSLTEQFGLDEARVESSEKGDQASLVMGRYLSPKLYVSYGVGLLESFNTFTVRYKISDNWQLKGESGEYQGADILYTIDR